MVCPLTTEAILGLDFMRKHEVPIDLEKTEINIGREDPITIHQHNQSPHVLGNVPPRYCEITPIILDSCYGLFQQIDPKRDIS